MHEVGSRPARARGLKRLGGCGVLSVEVAPRAGAWIETQQKRARRPFFIVAPRAGAWIETSISRRSSAAILSRPARARGLKPCIPVSTQRTDHVAPRAGAWIETKSHIYNSTPDASRPARARGLKLNSKAFTQPQKVAPRAGAWIETNRSPRTITRNSRAPRGRVD